MNSKMSALTISGQNSKVVAKEVFNSMYELTKTGTPVKEVNNKDKEKYLAMKPDDITRNFLTDLFASVVDISNGNAALKPRTKYNTWDKMKIPANYFYEGQLEIDTTIGRFIANKFILEGSGVISGTKYINELINKKKLGEIDTLVGQLYMTNQIDRKIFNSYLDHRDTLGYWLNGMLAHTISPKMAKPLPEIEKKKKELCEKYKKELSEGNIDIMTKISDELVAYAKEILKDDPGMDLYLSGDLDFGNNYKNNSILKGAVQNKITNGYDFIDTSFMNGIAIKDLPAHANSILASQYPASIATADAGYLGKKILALLQMMEIDYDNPDCGTKNTIPVTITKGNKDNMIYSYIKEGNSEIILDPKNINSYVGKTVDMRSPMSCISDKICAKCAGNLFKLLDVKHAGLYSVSISHSDLNLALKMKHNSVIDLYNFDPDNIIEDL